MKIANATLVANVALFAAGGLTVCGFARAQDAANGKAVFNQCIACHQLDSNMVGPKLKGVVGRKAGTAEGFSNYSSIMKTAAEAGLTWTEGELLEYLKNPTEYLTKYDKDKGKEAAGQSKMLFKLPSEQRRKDVVAYLASLK